MQNQPENPQPPGPLRNRDQQDTSVAMEPEATKDKSNVDRQDTTHQQNASGAIPRSMPWPEAPTTPSSTKKKHAPRPTQPSLDDDWFGAFQEPEPTFPSTPINPEPLNTPLRTPKARAKDRKPGPVASLGGEPSPHSVPSHDHEGPQGVTAPHPASGPTTPPPRASQVASLPGVHDEWNTPIRQQEQANAPNTPLYAPVAAPPSPEALIVPMPPSQTPPAGSASFPPAPPSIAIEAPATPQPTAPPSMAAPTPTTPVPPPPLSEVQALMNAPAPPAPGPISPPLALPPSPPSRLDDQWAHAFQEQQDANAPSPASYTPVPFTHAPAITHVPHPPNPMPPPPPQPAPMPPQEPLNSPSVQTEAITVSTPSATNPAPRPTEQLAFEKSSSTFPSPLSPLPSTPPVRNTASPSLDDEWVASQNESQEEQIPTQDSSFAASESQTRTAFEDPQRPNAYAKPTKWIPAGQQQSSEPSQSINPPHIDSSVSALQAPPPEHSSQPHPVLLQSEIAEEGVTSGSGSANHVVQTWPSAQSGKASTKASSSKVPLDSGGLDAAFSLGPLDPGHLLPDQSGEKDYGPFRRRHPTFTGSGRTLFGIFTTNTVWALLTLGIYSFWGRIKIRRYLHSQSKFAGSRFAFHGTGGELLLGWVKALVAFGIPYSALHYASGQHTEAVWQWSLSGLAGILVACFIPVAIVGSHRYRMSRTSWRNIRFSFRRSAAAFTMVYLKGVLLSLVTLGIYYPIFDHARRTFLTSGTHFGNQAFSFDGDPKVLGQLYFKAFRRLVLTLVTAEVFLLLASFLATQLRPEQVVDLVFLSSIGAGAIVIPILLGLWFWFQAAKQRYMWNHTTFGPGRFRATMKGRQIFELKCTNLILLVGSLGLAWAWVKKRNLQFLYYHLGFRGPLGLQHILQQATSASPMGEELAGFFDAGFEM